jgi:hypothetical protein
MGVHLKYRRVFQVCVSFSAVRMPSSDTLCASFIRRVREIFLREETHQGMGVHLKYRRVFQVCVSFSALRMPSSDTLCASFIRRVREIFLRVETHQGMGVYLRYKRVSNCPFDFVSRARRSARCECMIWFLIWCSVSNKVAGRSRDPIRINFHVSINKSTSTGPFFMPMAGPRSGNFSDFFDIFLKKFGPVGAKLTLL